MTIIIVIIHIFDSVIVYCNSFAEFILDEYYACGPAEIQATANDTSIYNDEYNWYAFIGPYQNGISATSVTFDFAGTTQGTDPMIFFPENLSQGAAITYTIMLVVENEIGNGIICTDTATKEVIIWPTPSAYFEPLQVDSCGPLEINFTNYSEPYNGETINTMTFEWLSMMILHHLIKT